MDNWQVELLDAVIQSHAFAKKGTQYALVLQHLARNSGASERKLRTEKHLLDHVLRTPNVAKISVFLARLQNAIDEYFDGDGAHHLRRIRIIRGKNVDAGSPKHNSIEYPFNHESERFTRAFWARHLTPNVATHVAYGLPLFTHSPDMETFTRRIDQNQRAQVHEDASKGVVCWPFVTLGDVLSVMEVMKWLSERAVPVASQWYFPNSTVTDVLQKAASEKDNIVIVGSKRVNGVLGEYQAKSEPRLPYQLGIRAVERLDPSGEVIERIEEGRRGSEQEVPVVISRRRGRRFGFVTIIASNHGRAVQRATEILTHEELLRGLFKDPRLHGWADAIPDRFQIVLKIAVETDEMFAGRYSIIDVWREPSEPERPEQHEPNQASTAQDRPAEHRRVSRVAP